MILDIFCIIISLLVGFLGDNKFCDKIKEKIINRYLDSYESDSENVNIAYNVFSDKDAIQKVFSEDDK